MLNVYDGTTWAEPSALRRWDGAAWVDADGYRWDGAEWVPIFQRAIPLSDDFNRPDGVLGMTAVGDREWQPLVGTMSIAGNRVTGADGSAAVVEAHTADVDISLDVSSGGRDAIVFRAADASNYWLVERYYNRSSSTTCTPVTRYCAQQSDVAACDSGRQTYCSCGGCPGQFRTYTCIGCYTSSTQNCSDSCSTSTSNTHRVYLSRVQGGTKSTVQLWNVSSSLSQLRVRAVGDTIEVWTAASTVQTVTGQSFNQTATRHGVGRGTYGNRSGTAIDNFALTPVS